MLVRSLLFNALFLSTLGFCADEHLWFIEQDFVKFGKKEAYEKYKKALLGSEISAFSTFAAQSEDSLQYIYLIPVKDYCGLGEFLQKRAANDQSFNLIPYLSTLNFTMGSVQRYLPSCSYIPRGKEALTAYRYLYFYLLGITPGNEEIFEARLQTIAEKQAEGPRVCFRSWKILIGSHVPKYLVATFATSEHQAQNQAEELELIDAEIKNIVSSQKQGSAVFRRDLSLISARRNAGY